MDYNKMIDNLNKRVPKPVEETYIDEDGLMRCTSCHGKRETIIEIFGQSRKVSCVCSCQQAAALAEDEAIEKRAKMRKIEEMRRTGFTDKKLMECTFENDDGSQPKVLHIAKNYVENFDKMKEGGKGLLLYGGVGTGKTYAAASIANALIDKGISAMVTNFARISNKLQERFEKKQAYLDNLNKFDLLVLDDLAAERSTEYMQEIVYNVIDARYRAGLPMIITTNLSLETIKNPPNPTDNRIYDRILEKCFPVEVKGKSHRRQNIKDEYENMKGLLGLN